MTSSIPLSQPLSSQALSRSSLLSILKTAVSIGENRYARRLALAWLATFPGDLEISFLNASAFLQEGQPRQALPILERICEVDSEFLEAQKLLAHIRQLLGIQGDNAKDCAVALGGRPMAKSFLPKWVVALREAQQALGGVQAKTLDSSLAKETALAKAEGLVHQALVENPPTPLAAITHLKITAARPDLPPLAVRDLAQAYHGRWPDCLVFSLVLADSLMDNGRDDQAVSLLHQAVADDITGQVARRLWGAQHRYATLWPAELVIEKESLQKPQDIPIPAAVSAAMGWNMLAPGQVSINNPQPTVQSAPEITSQEVKPTVENKVHQERSHRPYPKYQIPEALVSVQQELEQIAQRIKQPALGKADGRFPIYVIFSTYSGLVKQYGAHNTALLDLEMRKLADAIGHRKNWGSFIYYADQPEMAPGRAYQLKPVSPSDPWEMKLALSDLDAILGKHGEMIGALLIVGGPDVVPFHRLPNPVDDTDFDIPSDNPYATRDENYFIPEWPLGRLPGESGDDPKILLDSLAQATQYHSKLSQASSSSQQWWKNLAVFSQKFWQFGRKELPSMGYSAAIWRRASLSVFRSIGEPRHLLISPPIQIQPNGNQPGHNKASALRLPGAKLGYFNLHGLPDAPEWFGQRDASEAGNDPDYPLALRPEDIGSKNGFSNGKTPQVIFSEACYGAHIQEKTCEQAISLKFLAAGSLAFIGSTVTSYGSITSPLIAADLLGRAFWGFLGEGLPTGEALRRAKVTLAKEMHRRQGYLDGEDQKTLISFVLYGDPLAQASQEGRNSKSVLRSLATPAQVKTICDKGESESQLTHVPPEVMKQVKLVVSQYLPGMKGAHLSFHDERAGCNGGEHTCPTAQFGAKSLPNHPPHRKVVILSKQIQQASKTHWQYARLTLNQEGKLVKLVVSR